MHAVLTRRAASAASPGWNSPAAMPLAIICSSIPIMRWLCSRMIVQFSVGGCDQFVQLSVGHIQFGVCLFDGRDQVAHPLGGGASRRGDFFRLSLDPAEKVQADRLVDF